MYRNEDKKNILLWQKKQSILDILILQRKEKFQFLWRGNFYEPTIHALGDVWLLEILETQ